MPAVPHLVWRHLEHPVDVSKCWSNQTFHRMGLHFHSMILLSIPCKTLVNARNLPTQKKRVPPPKETSITEPCSMGETQPDSGRYSLQKAWHCESWAFCGRCRVFYPREWHLHLLEARRNAALQDMVPLRQTSQEVPEDLASNYHFFRVPRWACPHKAFRMRLRGSSNTK